VAVPVQALAFLRTIVSEMALRAASKFVEFAQAVAAVSLDVHFFD